MPEEHVRNVHQDDDGFESLNGNVSSDNDKVTGRAQRNRSREQVAREAKDRASWSEGSTSQQISLPSSKRSGLIHRASGLVVYACKVVHEQLINYSVKCDYEFSLHFVCY